MTSPRNLTAVALLLLACASVSCNQKNPTKDHANPANSAGTDAEERAEHPAQGHEHAERGNAHDESKEPSDLDRPLSELVTLSCEHQKKTFECDECRYEVGFVRAPTSLIQGGLLTTTQPAMRRVASPVALTGEVRFDERRIGHVSTQVQGIITRVYVVLGDPVKKGQPLLEIDSVAVGDEQAAHLEIQGMLRLAKRNFERVAELRKESIASEKEYLQAAQELEAAEIRAAGTRAKLNRLGGGTAAGGRIVLRAPLDGTVLVMHAVAGEVARTDDALVTVGDNTAVWVWADLYERDIAAVRHGQSTQPLAATIAVKAYPGEEFPGTVDLVSPAMDESSRTVKVRIRAANSDRKLLAGMFATVKVFLPGTTDTLALPERSVLEDDGRHFVFVHHQGDYYVRRPVVVGRRWAEWVEITKGVESSQTVVADGAFLLKSDVLRSKMGAGCAD